MSRPRRLLFALAALATVLGLLPGCRSTPPAPHTAPAVDLPAVMGDWYVIAHVPYFTERGHVGGRDQYTLRDDGRIAVRYLYRTGFSQPWKELDATATVKPGTGNRTWRLKFFRFVGAEQQILEVAPDNSWMLLAAPGRDLAWIFARRPVLDETLYRSLVDKLHVYGVDTDKVWRMPHVPEQVGRPGFERPNDP